MGVTVAVTRVACPTTTGNQNITTTNLGGLTPKAALFIVSSATADGTPAGGWLISRGAASGASNRWAVAATEGDNLDTTAAAARHQNDCCVLLLDVNGTDTIDGQADFSQWLTNGVQINWSNAPSSAYLMTVIFFAGTDLSAHANRVQVTDTVDHENDVTAPGFEPDVIFTATDRNSASPSDHNRNGFGLVHNDGVGGITQRSLALYDLSNQASGYNYIGVTDNGGILTTATSFDWWGEFANFDANGFSIIERNAGGNNQYIYYLALSFGGAVSSWVGTYQTPTSTGNDSETAPNFTPQFLFLIGHQMQTIDTTSGAGPEASAVCISAMDANDEYCTVLASEDAAATSNTQSISDDQAINLTDDDGTARVAATFVSFDANGWTFNYSAVGSNPFLFFALAIEEETAGGGTVNKDLAVQYDIRNLVNKDLQAQYDLFNLVNKDLAIPYDIRNLAGRNLEAVFDIENLMGKDLSFVYDILGQAQVGRDLATVYDILDLANGDLDEVYDILNLIGKDLAIQYDITGLVGKNLAVQFDIKNLIGDDLIIEYDILGLVGKDFAAQYDVGNLVGRDLVVVYDLRNIVNKDLAVVYDIAGPISKDLNMVWSIFGTAGGKHVVVKEKKRTLFV